MVVAVLAMLAVTSAMSAVGKQGEVAALDQTGTVGKETHVSRVKR